MNAYIEVHDVSLDVPLFLQGERSSKTWFSTLVRAAFDPPRREFRTLLRNISLNLSAGDRLALLGRNGAGKSTLLRVLNGVFEPSKGRVEMTGTCQALLNTSLGFINEATVKENIFLRATAMGLGSSLLGDLVDPVLEFAGLEEKANHRFKTLSAGQRMRLGFSISTEVQHDIMLLDEWIGTGDAQFLHKAKERMQSRLHGSQIVVLASHNFGLLKDVCNKGAVLEGGELVYFGGLAEAVAEYERLQKNGWKVVPP